MHSAYVQRVERRPPQRTPDRDPEQGQLGEITVAYTQSVRRVGSQNWAKLYRLYYESVHWITGIEQGPDGSLWYELTDDLLHVRHFVPAAHVRPIHPDEISPISADVPPEEKRIEISLADQTLTAYEGSEMVLHTRVSTGIHIDNPPNGIPTDTPRGRFFIQTKFPSRHMGDGASTAISTLTSCRASPGHPFFTNGVWRCTGPTGTIFWPYHESRLCQYAQRRREVDLPLDHPHRRSTGLVRARERNPDQSLLTGKKQGSIQILVWQRDSRQTSFFNPRRRCVPHSKVVFFPASPALIQNMLSITRISGTASLAPVQQYLPTRSTRARCCSPVPDYLRI